MATIMMVCRNGDPEIDLICTPKPESKPDPEAAISLRRSAKAHSLTSDNGKEFAEPKNIADKRNGQSYFAHPYAS